MCYASSCNPRCGDCRPKRIIDAACPECGAGNEMTREAYLNVFGLPHKKTILEKKMLERGDVKPPVCAICGADLFDAFKAAVQPAACMRSRIICGYPCGRHVEEYREDAGHCPHMVPVGKLEEA